MVLSGPPDPAAWARLRALTGLSEETLHDRYWAHRNEYDRGTLNSITYWGTIARETGFPLDAQKQLALEAADIDLWTAPNPQMIDWAQRLQARGVKTGILSNIGDSMSRGILAKLAWVGEFTHHSWSHELRLIKPDAAIYLHAAEGLGCPPEQVLFIDDREENIAGAQAAGMQAIIYRDHESFLREMKDRGFDDLLA